MQNINRIIFITKFQNMRKLSLLFVLIALGQVAIGQEWTLTVGAESKALKCSKSNVVQETGFIGNTADRIYLMNVPSNTGKKHKNFPSLISYDYNLVEQGRVQLTDDENYSMYGGFVNDGSIDLMMTESTKSEYRVLKVSYDPATLTRKGEPVELASFARRENGKHYTFVSSSQSQEWLSVILAVVNDGEAEWLINMYDTGLDELWSMEFKMDVIDDYFVSDSGDVIVGGFQRLKNSDETRLQFSVLDGERERGFTCNEVLPELQNMEIVRYANGKIYCTGLLKGEAQDDFSRWMSGIYSLVYDTKAKRISKFEKVEFTKENICDLCNVTYRMKLKVLSTDKLNFASSHYDDEGTTLVYERCYDYYLNGTFTLTDYAGMLMYRIDNSGHILWHKTVPRDVQAPAGVHNGVRTRLIPAGDAYTMFFVDSPSNLTPKPGKPAAVTSLIRGKQILMAMTVDHQGNITRKGLQIPSKSVCIGAPHKTAENEYLLFLSQPFGSNACKLKFE